jgi:hypothetical protein
MEEVSQFNSVNNIFVTSRVFAKSISVHADAKIPMAISILPYGESVYVHIHLYVRMASPKPPSPPPSLGAIAAVPTSTPSWSSRGRVSP